MEESFSVPGVNVGGKPSPGLGLQGRGIKNGYDLSVNGAGPLRLKKLGRRLMKASRNARPGRADVEVGDTVIIVEDDKNTCLPLSSSSPPRPVFITESFFPI